MLDTILGMVYKLQKTCIVSTILELTFISGGAQNKQIYGKSDGGK